MATELEELVGFIANPKPTIRKVALKNLEPFSTEKPSIFKTQDLTPIKHLKFLIRDHPEIAQHAITILINLTATEDKIILENVATDDRFLGILFGLLVDPEEPNADLLAMLLANLSKWDGLKGIVNRTQDPPARLQSDKLVLNQLLDLFVKGMDKSYNKNANFDYLSYVFADLSKHQEIREFFLKRQDYDDVVPLNKIKVFTEHQSDIRRKGVASTIKNVAFDVPSHSAFLDEDQINILPYILLPITGNEQYDEDETLAMLPDLQFLPPDKQRDSDNSIIQTHIETLILLTTTREGRDLMRKVSVYPIIRETHLRVDDDGVREACERLVQVLMRDEAEEGTEDNDDNRIVEV
ncbi:putative cytoplasm protein [Thermochaetoides thermophila DSM 1495]|uniref:Protein HGH1 homolog n=1 Tax=Chaetomium thermophilum (strain DSM 1495 / CBS 144.50 / IMI 039719) TaxID=759272 RepID=G0S5J3_CHATD|nr:putative cytoplasm protein [Thermochaetoides thermophila DSM 1495]EGS21458.1 putative cytoplasm protein [Thermochaetoides thermophila DSM 1495]